MNKSEFIDRLVLAANAALDFAKRSHQAEMVVPNTMVFTLCLSSTFKHQPSGEIKFLGGRLIRPENLVQLPAGRAGPLLWVDGKVPEWVNIGLVSYTSAISEYELRFSSSLVLADERKLSPDANMKLGNELAPFRIRGPIDLSWLKL